MIAVQPGPRTPCPSLYVSHSTRRSVTHEQAERQLLARRLTSSTAAPRRRSRPGELVEQPVRPGRRASASAPRRARIASKRSRSQTGTSRPRADQLLERARAASPSSQPGGRDLHPGAVALVQHQRRRPAAGPRPRSAPTRSCRARPSSGSHVTPRSQTRSVGAAVAAPRQLACARRTPEDARRRSAAPARRGIDAASGPRRAAGSRPGRAGSRCASHLRPSPPPPPRGVERLELARRAPRRWHAVGQQLAERRGS